MATTTAKIPTSQQHAQKVEEAVAPSRLGLLLASTSAIIAGGFVVKKTAAIQDSERIDMDLSWW